MTIRENLQSTFRKCHILFLLGWVVMISGMFGIMLFPITGTMLGWLGAALLGMSFVWQLIQIRCPKCKARVGAYLDGLNSWFHKKKPLKFCPFCGVDLDTQLDQ